MNYPNYLFIKEEKLNQTELLLFSSIKTTLTSLVKFALGIHKKLTEELELPKLILTGIMRTEEIQVKKKFDILAKIYPNLFIMTQFFQNSFKASHGNFLELVFCSFDDEKNATCNLNPKNFLKYLENPRYYHYHSLKLKYDGMKKDKVVLESISKLKFISDKFSNSKIDIVKFDEEKKLLLLAEQRSKVMSGGTSAAQSNFEKGNLFLSEIQKMVTSQHKDLEVLLDAIKSKGIKEVRFISSCVFAENGDWGTIETDLQLNAKKNEFTKIREKAKKIVSNEKNLFTILFTEECESEFSIVLSEYEVKLTFKYIYGLEYLSEIIGKEVEVDIFQKFVDNLNDDLWVAYIVSIKEREIYNLENTNHIEKLLEFLNSNKNFIDSWKIIKRNSNAEELDKLIKVIVNKYIDDDKWEKTECLAKDIKSRLNYLEKILYIIFMSNVLFDFELLETNTDITLDKFF